MLSGSVSIPEGLSNSRFAVLVASPDSLLLSDLQRIFNSLEMRVETATDGESALDAMQALEDTGVILLDVQLAGVANGRLLAALQSCGLRRRYAIALIADEVSDEWITRLREGAIDDIVPRKADAAMWSTHLSTMRRGQELYWEVEHLREAALIEVRHDRVSGALQREAMLTCLFRETDRVQRLHGELSLVLFDVDHFGHWKKELERDACDGMLHQMAQRIGRILRSYDLLGRTGNDEFLLALPGCGTVNAATMAERLRVEVFGDAFLARNKSGEIVSVRLTSCFAVTSSRGRSPVVVLREAEQTLALAKRSGPDSIRCAGESSQSDENCAGFATLYTKAGAPAQENSSESLS
jgi:two-component system cell cycle response regulator